ncbi:DUF3472 domain-containing protein [Streptomyces sp. NP160]|uniref:DUF3472 domain-containing protein n=1 Tax=Streptomyces sp. NP160 TaxID=2586637 RepID=UPI00111B101F|nr:DUF3472 domain-containing protein [Streptomyces sp. NP160]TNM59471.1 DUF3472 domain-containing protein [Streptomyces sp. NP160]
MIKRASVAALAVLALLLGASPAAAAQHQNAYYYTHWSVPGSDAGFYNVDQVMTVNKRATATYWALAWNWTAAPDGGYTGLQTNGNRFNGTTGDTAIFSLWNATAASGPSCGAFDGEGSGLSCRLPYTITTGTSYRLRVWQLDADADGQWWGAWLLNRKTGKETFIGSLRVAPEATAITGAQNFAEYFGTQKTCSTVPQSSVTWNRPSFDSDGSGGYAQRGTYVKQAGDKGACTGGSATPVTTSGVKSVRVVLGGSSGA